MRSEALAALLLATAAAAAPMVGPSVGNADLLASEGSRLYNEKMYAEAAAEFHKAVRANPAALTAYLQLARSQFAAKQLPRACYVYRAYLKAAPESPERKKAEAESGLCERQLKALKKSARQFGGKFVEIKAAFYAALEQDKVLGPGSAAELMEKLIEGGFVSPELAEMAAKLHGAALARADELHKRALAGQAVKGEELRRGRPLYQLAADVGPAHPEAAGRSAFLDGMALAAAGEHAKAAASFADASAHAPQNLEYRYRRAVSVFRSGDKKGALQLMEQEMADDPRTALLRAHLSLGDSPERGAAELERLLFSKRFERAR